MRGKRLRQSLHLALIPRAKGRADYLRKQRIFAHIGQKVTYVPRVLPLYANLISIGDHVTISANVNFATHDGIHRALNWYSDRLEDEGRKHRFQEALGCIEIGNNVFISAGARILYDVRIGDNVIVSAGSVVANDIPSNSVVRGAPAKVICSFDDYYNLKAFRDPGRDTSHPPEEIPDALAQWLWEEFYAKRGN